MNYGIPPVLIRPRPRGKGINPRGKAGRLYAGSSWPPRRIKDYLVPEFRYTPTPISTDRKAFAQKPKQK